MSRRGVQGFTLLEICMAVMIGLMVISIAVPSVQGLFAEQRLKESFDRFDDFVRKAKNRAVVERRGFLLVWEEEGIVLEPIEPLDDDRGVELERLPLSEGQKLTIERPAALEKEPFAEWPFWRSGLCEPAIISYEGPEGSWKVEYNALTGRGTFLDQSIR